MRLHARPRGPDGLAARLMTGHVVVVAVGALTLAASAALIAPALFRQHLRAAGVTSAPVRQHAEAAFASSFTLSLTAATLAALVAAGVTSWVLVRQVTAPLAQLAQLADAVAAGHFDVGVEVTASSGELQRLAEAFTHMASQLADTDASRTRLLSDLSHELRTPLATLSAYIDGMQDGVVAQDAPSWDTMRDQVRRLSRLTTDVRDAAAAQEGALDVHTRPVDPVELVTDAVDAAAPRYAGHGVALTYRGPKAAPSLLGDPQRLAQVLANLLDNSLRHTPNGGHVTLDVTSTDRNVTITVSDDGDGIPIDQLESVFDRFHRGDPSRAAGHGTGSGLGLTIARAIVGSHHGTLVADSPGPGLGTTMTLTLPAHAVVVGRGHRPPG